MSLDGVQEKLQMIWNGENIKTKDKSRKDHRGILNQRQHCSRLRKHRLGSSSHCMKYVQLNGKI